MDIQIGIFNAADLPTARTRSTPIADTMNKSDGAKPPGSSTAFHDMLIRALISRPSPTASGDARDSQGIPRIMRTQSAMTP